MEILKDNNNQYKRVYIKLPVTNKNVLIDLQQKIPMEIFSPEELHLTLIHFGKPQDIYCELKKVNPKLEYSSFISSLLYMLADIKCIEIKEYMFNMQPEKLVLNINMYPEDIDLFGDNIKNIVVLKLKKNKELTIFRNKILNRFKQFLKENGIRNIDQFINSSPNFLHQIKYNPHISLGIAKENTKIPNIEIEAISLYFQDMVIANVI